MGSEYQQEDHFSSFVKAELNSLFRNVVAEHRRVASTNEPVYSSHNSQFEEVVNIPCQRPQKNALASQEICVSDSDLRTNSRKTPLTDIASLAQADELVIEYCSEASGRIPPQPVHDHSHDEAGAHQSGELIKFCELDIWRKHSKLKRSVGTSCWPAVSKTADLECQELERLIEFDRMRANRLVRAIQFLDGLILQPNSVYTICWGCVGLMLIIWDMIAVPLFLFGPNAYPFIRAVSWPGLLYWSLDIVASFFIGYVSSEGNAVLSFVGVCKRYLRSRFALDVCLLSCMWVVFVIDVTQDSDDLPTLRTIGALRVLQLLRMHRLVYLIRLTENLFIHVRSESRLLIVYLCIVMCVLLLLIHVMGCIWHSLSDGDWTRNWSTSEAYVHSVHVVLSAFVGEHVVAPETHAQRCFFVFLLLFGFVVCSAFVGTLTTTMTRLQHLARKRSALFASLSRFLDEQSISKDLIVRINRNAQYALTEKKLRIQEEDVELLLLISDNLRAELHYEIHSPALMEYPFLRLFNIARPTAIQNICHTAVSVTKLSKGDAVFSEMEVPTKPKMLFCVSGVLRYYSVSYKVDEVVHVKRWVSEPVLWTTWTHRGTLRALHDSQLLRVDAVLFAEIMCSVQMAGITKGYAQRFVTVLNDAESNEAVTDLGPSIEDTRRLAMETFQEGDSHFKMPSGWHLGVAGRRHNSVTSLASMFSRRPSMENHGRLSVESQDMRLSSSSDTKTSFVQVRPSS